MKVLKKADKGVCWRGSAENIVKLIAQDFQEEWGVGTAYCIIEKIAEQMKRYAGELDLEMEEKK